MRTLKAYSKIITDKKELAFFKELTTLKLSCKASQNVYYPSGGLWLKLNKSITIVPLAKVTLGRIIYMSNNVLSIGEFLYISEKDFTKLKTLNLSLDKEQNFAGWRHFWYRSEVLEEFVNPIEELQTDLRNMKAQHNDLADSIERYELEEKQILKRFI